jgi:uncharacterized membrane protein (DUF485 family)
MWSSVLVVGILFGLNPGLLGAIVLLISRPRPVQSLLAFWGGSVTISICLVVIPLLMLHLAPSSVSFTQSLATPSSSTARNSQIGMGVLTLLIAAVMTVIYLARRRSASRAVNTSDAANVSRRAQHGQTAGSTQAVDTQTLVLDSETTDDTEAAASRPKSAIRRLSHRVYMSWENGSLWVAYVIGMTFFPGPPVAFFVVSTVAAAGVAIGTEILAVIAFIVAMLTLVEIILAGYVIAPARTQTALRPLHSWTRAHRWQVLIAIFAVMGFWQIIRGLGIG